MQEFDAIIRSIAKNNTVSVQAVIDEMQKAIDEGYGSPDPAVQAEWAKLPFSGKPTPQEFIIYLAGITTSP